MGNSDDNANVKRRTATGRTAAYHVGTRPQHCFCFSPNQNVNEAMIADGRSKRLRSVRQNTATRPLSAAQVAVNASIQFRLQYITCLLPVNNTAIQPSGHQRRFHRTDLISSICICTQDFSSFPVTAETKLKRQNRLRFV